MKFDMGSQTLTQLVRETDGSQSDLTGLVQRLVAAAEPMYDDFHGAGRQAFDSFKLRTDQITSDLNSALAAIVGGQAGMDTAFQTGDSEAADNATQAIGTANFDGARFSARA